MLSSEMKIYSKYIFREANDLDLPHALRNRSALTTSPVNHPERHRFAVVLPLSPLSVLLMVARDSGKPVRLR
jgi:hypothetical protein